MCDSVLCADVFGLISRHCDAPTRRALALTCRAVARELAKPCHVDEALERLSKRVVELRPKEFPNCLGRIYRVLPNGVRHGPAMMAGRLSRHPTLIIYQEVNFKFGVKHGIFTSFLADGSTFYTLPYAEGKRNGIEEGWDGEDNRTHIRPWVDDKKQGLELFWGKDGSVRHALTYVDDQRHGIERRYRGGVLCEETPWVNGKVTGVATRWHDANTKASVSNWLDDKEHGWHEEWNTSGMLVVRKYFENGRLVTPPEGDNQL